MAYVNPPFISEREPDGSYEDCVPSSALMLVLAHHPNLAPATHAEMQRLRTAAGYGTTGYTSVEKIATGVRKRYGLIPRIIGAWPEFWTAMKPGRGAFVIIRPDVLPVNHPLRVSQPAFHNLHCVYVARKGWRRRVWAMDPMGKPVSTYKGAWVSKSDLQKCFRGSAGILSIAKAP